MDVHGLLTVIERYLTALQSPFRNGDISGREGLVREELGNIYKTAAGICQQQSWHIPFQGAEGLVRPSFQTSQPMPSAAPVPFPGSGNGTPAAVLYTVPLPCRGIPPAGT